MTAVWGPLGWMTLHSVSSLYPETPTVAEQQLMRSWLDMFRDTITCHFCKSHFTEMLDIYRRKFPGMLNSRQELMAFAFRAHNTVNRRLHKPIYNSVAECMEQLRNNIKVRSAGDYRRAYLTHIRKYWSTMRDTSGIVAIRKIGEMIKIENDYCVSRDTNFNVEIQETPVIFPLGVLEKEEEVTLMSRLRNASRPVQVRDPKIQGHVENPTARIPVAGFRVTRNGIRLR